MHRLTHALCISPPRGTAGTALRDRNVVRGLVLGILHESAREGKQASALPYWRSVTVVVAVQMGLAGPVLGASRT